jgi:hypothetical protein
MKEYKAPQSGLLFAAGSLQYSSADMTLQGALIRHHECRGSSLRPSRILARACFSLLVLATVHDAQSPGPTQADRTPRTQTVQPNTTVRDYFIAADEVDWDYTPRGRNLAGLPHGETEGEEGPKSSSHRVYHKAVYHEYTDSTFKTLKPRAPEWEHLGILGPLIRAEVGQSIRVVFRNNIHLWVTMHPHGLQYTKDSEGAWYNDGTLGFLKADDKVAPGNSYTYIWSVPESSGPGPMDGSSVLWMYHSHFVEPKDMNTGLLGPIIITGRNQSRPDGRPKGRRPRDHHCVRGFR